MPPLGLPTLCLFKGSVSTQSGSEGVCRQLLNPSLGRHPGCLQCALAPRLDAPTPLGARHQIDLPERTGRRLRRDAGRPLGSATSSGSRIEMVAEILIQTPNEIEVEEGRHHLEILQKLQPGRLVWPTQHVAVELPGRRSR